jgi:ATP-binding cassette, subfamily B, bacterial
VPVFYLVVKLFGRRLRHLGVRLQEADAAAVALATENLTMVPAIKAFTREAPESRRYADRLEAIRQLNASQARAFAAMEPAFQFIATGVAVLVLWAAAERAGSGAMGAAGFVSFILYGALLTRPVGRIAAAYGQALMARGTLDRLQRVLAEPPEPLHAALHDLPPVRGEIDIEALRFAYAGRPAVFDGLNLHVAAGEIVALTGRNGSGKSTLAALLLRLHEPQGGRILLDGVDIREVSLHSLRRSIAVVPQHVLLLNASVAENIAFGRTGASREEVVQAARRAHAHEFITALPEGYETVVGDQGVRLSGGQRQRIALARALLKDAPILVLDEPTAMFDPQAEEDFVRSMRQALGDRTTLLITHRPASLQLADRVVDLDAIKP